MIKMTEEQILYEGDWLRFCRRGTFEYVRRVRGRAAAIIIAMTEDRHVVLVEQYRHSMDCSALELPAGLVGDEVVTREETILEGAQRELLEETGYEATRMHLMHYGPASSGLSSELMYFCYAEGLVKRHEGGGDATENIIVHHAPLVTIHDYLASAQERGLSIDPKIYLGLYWIGQRS
ncbi:MAG: NUDIX hydrolase [Alphaproteobacteria bacterium]|nr:MAG: NUDIX hydrolase [Alphaproteobacteria bacterium]TAF16019.1 MAG: NUDIX hydrolase [Alphaproteobacteria bacterium]TAF76208.1 MAG: NUDIX hydrolase [Alphaproteobacteria bacterium]